MSFINAVVGLMVLICFFVAVSRLGEIRDELRYQSQLLSRAPANRHASSNGTNQASRDAELASMPTMAQGIRLDDPADDK